MVSGITPPVFKNQKPTMRILVSYHYFKDTNLDVLFESIFDYGERPIVFGDSGAFSADNLGVKIDLNDYISWVKRWEHHFDVYANLDVIGDASATIYNQKLMQDKGLNPLPVFHQSEPFEYLRQYLDNYNYIGLGFLHSGGSQNALMRWFIRCFKMAEGRAVFHGFGVTGWKMLAQLKFYSVDSTTWLNGARFGAIPLFDWRRSHMKSIQLGDVQSMELSKGLVRSYGVSSAMYTRETNTRQYNVLLGAMSFMKAEQFLREKHGLIDIPNQDDVQGLNLYLSNTTPKEWIMLSDWFKRIEWL